MCGLFVDQSTIEAARNSGHWARTLQRIFRETLAFAKSLTMYSVLASTVGKFKAAVAVTYPHHDIDRSRAS